MDGTEPGAGTGNRWDENVWKNVWKCVEAFALHLHQKPYSPNCSGPGPYLCLSYDSMQCEYIIMVYSHWQRPRLRQTVRPIEMAYIELYEGVHTALRPYQWCHWLIGLCVGQCEETIRMYKYLNRGGLVAAWLSRTLRRTCCWTGRRALDWGPLVGWCGWWCYIIIIERLTSLQTDCIFNPVHI